MFGCYSKKLHRLLPARDSLEASVPSFCLRVLAPGESWGSFLEQNCLPGKGVVCLNIPLGRTQQDKEQVTSTTVLHCHHCHAARSPAFPCHLGRHALVSWFDPTTSGMCFGQSSVPVLTPLC